ITEWDQFRALDLDRVKELMKTPTVVDLRNVYQPSDMERRGFNYVSVGRST
ncbi:MAG: UDP binding domain-containing protein, partial [Novosphingobium sp.]|nr:UDP binding domain-containing protein [Novosphingobium sp.]